MTCQPVWFPLLAAAVMLSSAQASAAAGDGHWPDWRGPTADGRSDATGLPLTWSETENIVWKTPIHDDGYSTPVVWGDQIWLTTATEDGHTLYAVCVDVNTGAVVHDIEVFHPSEPQHINPNNSYATPSAVVEEGRVYVHYGTHGTAGLNTKTGEVLWRRTDLNCDHVQGPVSSPILFENLLIVHLEGGDVQFVAALNKNTGETVWRYDRPRELYEGVEPVYLVKAYQTPVIVEVDGQPQMLSNGALLVTSHDPRTGQELWRVRYRDDSTISRIVSGLGLHFINTGGSPDAPYLWAVRQGGAGDVTDTHVVWKMTEDVPLKASPVLVGDLLYTISDKGVLLCIEGKTGEIVWSQRIRDDFGPSLLYAGHRIYILSMKGKTTVIEPGREFRQLALNELDGRFGASPVVVGKSLLLRSKTHLYLISDKQGGRE
jgi:outer membrane protein assembly factor BamB